MLMPRRMSTIGDYPWQSSELIYEIQLLQQKSILGLENFLPREGKDLPRNEMHVMWITILHLLPYDRGWVARAEKHGNICNNGICLWRLEGWGSHCIDNKANLDGRTKLHWILSRLDNLLTDLPVCLLSSFLLWFVLFIDTSRRSSEVILKRWPS